MTTCLEIACLGDSIANGFYDETGKGWVVRMVEKFNADKPHSLYLNNYARSGDRTSDTWHKLCHSVIPAGVNALIISIGVNDLIRWGARDNAIDTSEVAQKEYMTKILDTAKKNIEHVIFIGGTPTDESLMPLRWSEPPFWNLNADIIHQNKWHQEFCAAREIPYFNPYDGFMKAGGLTLLHDGLHPNTAGHEWIADFAYQALRDIKPFR